MKFWMLVVAVVVIALAGVVLSTCGDESADGGPGFDPALDQESARGFAPAPGEPREPEPGVYPLVMGADAQRVGTVRLSEDGDRGVEVLFEADAGNYLQTPAVCASLAGFEWTAPGQCAFQGGDLPDGVQSATVRVALEDVGGGDACGSHLIVQAQAEITDESGEKTGSAYAGEFKGQVKFRVLCD